MTHSNNRKLVVSVLIQCLKKNSGSHQRQATAVKRRRVENEFCILYRKRALRDDKGGSSTPHGGSRLSAGELPTRPSLGCRATFAGPRGLCCDRWCLSQQALADCSWTSLTLADFLRLFSRSRKAGLLRTAVGFFLLRRPSRTVSCFGFRSPRNRPSRTVFVACASFPSRPSRTALHSTKAAHQALAD